MKSFISVLCILFLSCGASSLQQSRISKSNVSSKVDQNIKKRFVTKNITQEVSTTDISKVDSAVTEILNTYEGYISRSEFDINDEFDAHIKIPSKYLQSALLAFASIGEEVNRDITTTDVTDDYIDLNARITNLEKLKAKVQHILETTTDLNKVLELQKEVNRLQTTIDSLKGRLASLKDRIDYSTVHLRIYQESKPGPLSYVGIATGWVIKKLFVWN